MRAAPWSGQHKTRRMQLRLHPGVAPAEIMLLLQMLVKVLDRPARVPRAVLRKHPVQLVDRHAPGRRLAQAFVEQTFKTFLLIAAPVAPELTLRTPQDLARIHHRKLSALPAAQYIDKLLHPAVL
jgi:hypothetical protein